MKTIKLDRPAAPDDAALWQDDELLLLDQRLLPQEEKFIHCENAADVASAIAGMVVRGAPAIGVTAAYGVVLAARDAWRGADTGWKQALQDDLSRLEAARPTAVNLAWAIARMGQRIQTLADDADPEPALLAEARAIHDEDIAANHVLGDLGASLIEKRTAVITHCNAGALATGGYGTALGVIRSAWAAGKSSPRCMPMKPGPGCRAAVSQPGSWCGTVFLSRCWPMVQRRHAWPLAVWTG